MERLLEPLARLLRSLASLTTQGPGLSPLQILVADDAQLVIQGRHGLLCFERRRRIVRKDGRPVASFDAITGVRVRHHRGSDDEPEHWSVDLQVKGWFSGVSVGASQDDVDASIAAARIATFVGKPVRAG